MGKWTRPGPRSVGSCPLVIIISTNRNHSYVFGWGRRFCQGSYIAEASLFIVLSRLLWGIDFQAPIDEKTGKPIIPDIADDERTFSDGFVSIPKLYNITFKPRSEKSEAIIRKAWDEAQGAWEETGMAPDERQ